MDLVYRLTFIARTAALGSIIVIGLAVVWAG